MRLVRVVRVCASNAPSNHECEAEHAKQHQGSSDTEREGRLHHDRLAVCPQELHGVADGIVLVTGSVAPGVVLGVGEGGGCLITRWLLRRRRIEGVKAGRAGESGVEGVRGAVGRAVGSVKAEDEIRLGGRTTLACRRLCMLERARRAMTGKSEAILWAGGLSPQLWVGLVTAVG
jgi:hypothetical protein